jgi:hypothetical protein
MNILKIIKQNINEEIMKHQVCLGCGHKETLERNIHDSIRTAPFV